MEGRISYTFQCLKGILESKGFISGPQKWVQEEPGSFAQLPLRIASLAVLRIHYWEGKLVGTLLPSPFVTVGHLGGLCRHH